MSDIFDHDGSRDGLRPEDRPFRSREELEAENERLREDLHRTREENELLAELLTGQFEDGSGEIAGGEEESGGSSGDSSELEQRFTISEAAIDLFEALPLSFTLDEAFDRAERLGQPSAEAARHLRSFVAERMVVQEAERFAKTGAKPYF